MSLDKENEKLKADIFSLEVSLRTFNFLSIVKQEPTRLRQLCESMSLYSKLRGEFTKFQQQFYIMDTLCSLTHEDEEFIFDFDQVWRWAGFNNRRKALRVLKRHWRKDKEYIELSHGNTDKFLLTRSAFKYMCCHPNTKKSVEIMDYIRTMLAYKLLSASLFYQFLLQSLTE